MKFTSLHLLLVALVVQTVVGDTENGGGLSIDHTVSGPECLESSVEDCGTEGTIYNYDIIDVPTSSSPPPSLNVPGLGGDKLSDIDYALFKSRNASWQATNQDISLRQVLIIHRHGDRTPITFPPKDSISSEPFWTFHGLGQLTNRGKARLYLLGKMIRDRYNRFLEGSVNKNMRKSRSSGALRCIESAQTFLSGFLSLDVQNSPDANQLIWGRKNSPISQLWQPSSVNTMSAKYDGFLNEGAECKALNEIYAKMDLTPESKRISEEYKHEADVMNEQLGFTMDHFYKWFWGSSVVEVERSYFPQKIKPEVLAIYDRLQEAGDLALGIYQSTIESRRLRAGLLINDMIKNMQDFRDLTLNKNDVDSTFTKKFVHYSAHDLNLLVLLGMFESWERLPTRPDYASNIILELHQDLNGVWFVKIFYMPHAPAKPFELHMKECENANNNSICTLDKFDELMQKYKIKDWQSWMKECGNDLTSVNPYQENS